MTDDQTVESMRVMSNVNRLLAANGATFDNSFASFSLCAPSRATFLTGQYSHDHGVVGNNLANGLARLDQSNTLPVWLRHAGYSTILVGKYLNEYGQLQGKAIPPGWTEWYGATKLAYYDHKINQRGQDREVRRRRPPTTRPTSSPTSRSTRSAGGRRSRSRSSSGSRTSRRTGGGPREADDPPGLGTPVAAPRAQGRVRVGAAAAAAVVQRGRRLRQAGGDPEPAAARAGQRSRR